MTTKIDKPDVALFTRSQKNSNKMLRRRDRFTDFAGAIADKARIDAAWLQADNKDHFYNVGEDLTDPELESLLVVLDADDETMDFIRNSVDKSDCVVTQMWHTAAKSVRAELSEGRTGTLAHGAIPKDIPTEASLRPCA